MKDRCLYLGLGLFSVSFSSIYTLGFFSDLIFLVENKNMKVLPYILVKMLKMY